MARKTKKTKVEDVQKELGEEKESLEVGYISFGFGITRDEADKVVNDPKHPVAKKLNRYMRKILQAGARKMLESDPNKNVNNCNVPLEKDLQNESK